MSDENPNTEVQPGGVIPAPADQYTGAGTSVGDEAAAGVPGTNVPEDQIPTHRAVDEDSRDRDDREEDVSKK